MALFAELFKNVPPEIAKRRTDAKSSYSLIGRLAPQLSSSLISYESASLPQSLLEQIQNDRSEPLARFACELDLKPDDSSLRVEFANFADRGRHVRALCLSRAGDFTQDRLKVFFHDETFQQGQIVMKTSAGTEVTPAIDSNSLPSYAQEEQLLPVLFNQLANDLNAARHSWASSLTNDRETYLEDIKGAASPLASDEVRRLVERVANSTNEGFMMVGEPLTSMEKGRLRLFTNLKINEEMAKRIVSGYQPDRRLSHLYETDLTGATGTYTLTLKDRNKGQVDTIISLQTYYPNKDRHDIFVSSTPTWSAFSASKAEQDFAHFLAGDTTHRWGLNQLDEAVLLFMSPNTASGIGRIF